MSNQIDTEKSKSISKVYGPLPLTDDEVMSKYGITSRTTETYYYGKYRYSSLNDAIAQAKRDERSQCS